MIAIGLLAAGLTSAITAPVAATLVLKSVFGWQGDLRSRPQRLAWISVLTIGTAVALLQINAVELIKFAQFANGLVLPFAVAFLLFAVNQKRLLGNYINGLWLNILTSIVLITVTGLGLWAVFKVVASSNF
jgi:Mn2+/Fe2+ NRAMP family transporter